VIQGTAADIVKIALIKINKQLREMKLGTKGGDDNNQKQALDAWILMHIHDELVWECKDTNLKAFVALIRESMESIVTISVPLPTRVFIGKKWGDLKPWTQS